MPFRKVFTDTVTNDNEYMVSMTLHRYDLGLKIYGMYKQQNIEFWSFVLGLHDCFDRDY